MAKLIPKISASLLAPVIFGAVCLSCLVQPSLALAATPPDTMTAMEQDKACAEYKDPETATVSMAVVQTVSTGRLMIADSGMASSGHNSNCRVVGFDAVIDGNILPQAQHQATAAILPPAIVCADRFQYQNSSLEFFERDVGKPDFMTGCVIKLE